MIKFNNISKLVIPEGTVSKIVTSGVTLWQSISYTNRVGNSIDADYNVYNGVGYKNGYRIRSGGAEVENSGASCTGYIRVTDGDVVRISGWNFSALSSANSINVSDISFLNLGQVTTQPAYYGVLTATNSPITESDGVYTYVIPPELGIAYIRVTGFSETDAYGPGSSMIVTVNEEIQ